MASPASPHTDASRRRARRYWNPCPCPDSLVLGIGARIYDGKDYFTIYDFVKAHLHFSDPEWDDEPVEEEPCPKCGMRPCACVVTPPPPCPVCGQSPCQCPKEPCPVCGQRPCVCNRRRKAKVKLADGKERNIQHNS